MKSLFESVSELSPENDFSIQYQIFGISKGWKIIDKMVCDDVMKRKLALYVSYAYSYQSPMLRKKKDRWDNKVAICTFINLDLDDFVLECVKNMNPILNRYITWWLRESGERDFAIAISGEDLLFELLQTSREGVEKIVTAKDERQAEKVMKAFTRMETIAKSEAYERAMKMKLSLEQQMHDLEKNYEYLYNTTKDEIDDFNMDLPLRERLVLRHRKKEL